MKTTILLFFLITLTSLQAQVQISGTVKTKNGAPVPGANVYIEGSYDGATTNEQGNFRFTANSTGSQTLVVSFISYETFKKKMEVSQMHDLQVVLREDVTSLGAVVLSAGTFSAGDNSKVNALKPLDVVTTAGVAGDFIAALQTLPGTQTVGEDGRLFVRGGTAEETGVYIDGIQVFQPYTASANNLPSRGRYSPFLFDGITFSTGGYSAEYGQALSSVLLLNTINEPDQTETNISLMSVGAGLGHTQKWKNSSFSVNTSYINLAPYLELIPNNEQAEFVKPYEKFGGETVYRKHFKNGIFKWYAAYEITNFELLQPDINREEPVQFDLKNDNFYTNLSYRGRIGKGWSLQPGISFSHSKNSIGIDAAEVDNSELAANVKLKLSKHFSNRFKLHFGAEGVLKNFSEDYKDPQNGTSSLEVSPDLFAGFAESDLIFSKNFAMKVGLRGTYLDLQQKLYLAPRASMALKAGTNGQFSLAWGKFFQQADTEALKYDAALKPETATHYILNYLWTKPGYTFRAETYYKNYNSLLKYDTEDPTYNSVFSNSGEGYARGLDLFWRDNETFDNLQYWLSYSFIDSERDFRNYEASATPQFVADHSASLVTKYWIDSWQSQVGFTYNFSSGRPFEDPNTAGFLNNKTKSYQSLSFNWAYLLSRQKILYFSVSNVLGRKNIFNYEYANTPSENGIFDRRAITPAADRFFFVGFFWTISSDKTKNQLDNL
ncbi:TonB-dependent receptor [Salinimicrobium soli]|uniref:TonB-dependent receptor n=1 Tax=Salinimicrobium soli TaxID=1254399 RepID=UPI003AAC9D7F